VRIRRGLLLLAPALAAAAILAPPASARPACAFSGALSSEHFTVHWGPDAGCGSGAGYFQAQAGETLAHAEAAYRTIVETWGYPAPLADAGLGGDDRLDIYVFDVSPAVGVFGVDPSLGGPASGWVGLGPQEALTGHWVATSAYYLSSLAVWGVFQDWFTFGSAEWGGLRASGFPPFSSLLDAPDVALDCYGQPCAETLFDYNGQARWPFFEYLADRFGPDVVRDVWQQVAARGASVPDGLGALADVLVAKGTTLTAVFNDFAGLTAAGAIDAASIAGEAPRTVATLEPGTRPGDTKTTRVAVNHLAARFVEVRNAGATTPCHPATLALELTLPAGVASVPSFYSKEYGGLRSFAVNGSKATLTTSWDTCTWADRSALVALPNPSSTVDGAEFTLTVTVTALDEDTVLSPDAPVPPTEPRPVVPTDDAVPPPTLSFHGSSAVRVARNGSVRLAFFATNVGTLRVSVGGKTLKSVRIRAGQNVVTLRLPAAKKPRTRRASLAVRPARLELTTFSPSGKRGKTVSRLLRYAP
jgi:hypothetical protein